MPIIIPSQNMNAEKWGGTVLTGRDISLDLKALIDDSIKGLMRSWGDAGAAPSNQTGKTALKLLDDIFNTGVGGGLAKTQVRDAANAWTDVGFYAGTLNMPVDLKANTIGIAKESGGNIASILSQLDITISALRDAITDAATPKDLKDLWDDLETIKGDTPALNDESVKGLLRSLGDAGAAPSNQIGKTALKLLTEVLGQLDNKTSTLAKETGGNLATIAGKDFATQTTLAAQLDVALSTRFQNSDLRGSSPSYGNITVANTATQIKAANASRKSILVQNLGTDNMYLGHDASVTTANGTKMLPGQAAEWIFCTSAIYGISDGGNIDTRYWESA